jgi:hypothetical protein
VEEDVSAREEEISDGTGSGEGLGGVAAEFNSDEISLLACSSID